MKTERKKHFTQMTSREKSLLKEKIKQVDIREWVVSKHAMERIRERNFKFCPERIVNCLTNFRPIEYKVVNYYGKRQERVLIRGNDIYNGSNLVMLFNVTDKEFITCWMNTHDDMHDAIDMEEYDGSLEVVE